MATARDEMALSESSGAGEKFQNSIGTSDQGENATTRISDLEQTLKQLTLTRFKIQHPATMENLPDEILSNIFIRLLAKQLAQMRTVSKTWNAFLSHPSFVKSQLHHSIHNSKPQVLLLFPFYAEPFKQYFSQSSHPEPTNLFKHIAIDPPIRVIGSVNGLICLSGDGYSNFHIWNPSLSAVSTIPQPHFISNIYPYLHYFRFGFDPKTDDYKLLKLSGICNFVGVKEWLKVEVYSMRKGSWEFITQPFPSHITWIYTADYLCVDGHDGHLHWETEPVVKTKETIVAFNLGSETFSEIPLPASILDSNHGMHQLGVLDGKLYEMSWLMDGTCEVWVMEEYGLPESWVKRHVFPQFTDDRIYLYGFTSRNELLYKDEYDRLVLYDPIANNSKFTRIEGYTCKIMEYVDSLVWL